MRERDQPILLPPNPAEHVTDWLFDIGPVGSNGMSATEIGWEAIDAWCRRTGIDLDPWEARTIRRLSRAFAAQQHDARKPTCPAPYSGGEESVPQRRDRVSAQFKAMWDKLAKRGQL